MQARKIKVRRPPRIDGAITYIKLPDGSEAMVDTEDLGKVAPYNWFGLGGGYAARRVTRTQFMYMQYELMGRMPGRQIDHINRNKLDNRRANLRFVTASENMANRNLRPAPSSGFRGVVYLKTRGLFRAQLRKDRRVVHTSFWTTAIEAARAYNAAALTCYGQFAALNPTPMPDDEQAVLSIKAA